jgi:hypothetical protein
MAGERDRRGPARSYQAELDLIRSDSPDVPTLVVEHDGHCAAPDNASRWGVETVVPGGLDRRSSVFEVAIVLRRIQEETGEHTGCGCVGDIPNPGLIGIGGSLLYRAA